MILSATALINSGRTSRAIIAYSASFDYRRVMPPDDTYIAIDIPPEKPRPVRTALLFGGLIVTVTVLGHWLSSVSKYTGMTLSGLDPVYTVLAPILGPVLRALKIYISTGSMGVLTGFFGLLFIRNLFMLRPLHQAYMEQIDLIEQAYGAVNKPAHRLWYGLSVFFLVCSLSLTGLPSWIAQGELTQLLMNMLRVGLFLGCGFASLSSFLLGRRLHLSWRRFKAGFVKQPVDDSHLQARSSADSESWITAEADEGLFIALAAEMVQNMGSRRQLPDYSQIQHALGELQAAARMTHSRQFDHSNLDDLCQKACDLLASGELKTLPNLQTAEQIYTHSDAGRLFDLAEELRNKLASPLPVKRS